MGDRYAHVTMNISPSLDGTSIDFFYTSEVVSVSDRNGAVLYRG